MGYFQCHFLLLVIFSDIKLPVYLNIALPTGSNSVTEGKLSVFHTNLRPIRMCVEELIYFAVGSDTVCRYITSIYLLYIQNYL